MPGIQSNGMTNYYTLTTKRYLQTKPVKEADAANAQVVSIACHLGLII